MCWLKFQGTVIIAGKALQQKCGAAGHTAAADLMWRDRNAGAQQCLLFYEVQDPSLWCGAADPKLLLHQFLIEHAQGIDSRCCQAVSQY